MALEPNNTAIQFDPGFDPEFERMLQHHLKRGGAPVAACSGFDADTASAFIENVLPTPARSLYESHLAGCPACRRHVIELSRFFETVPRMDPISASAPNPNPLWLKGKRAIEEWFDFSKWRWNGQSAGLAAAAMTILIAVFAVPVWRQANRPALQMEAATTGVAVSATPAPSEPAAEPTIDPAQGAEMNQSLVASTRREDTQSPGQLPEKPSFEVSVASGASGMTQTPIPFPGFSPQAEMATKGAFQESIEVKVLSPEKARLMESRDTVTAAPGPAGQQPTGSGESAKQAPPQDASAAWLLNTRIMNSQVGPSPDDNPMRTASGKAPPGSTSTPQPVDPKSRLSMRDRALALLPLPGKASKPQPENPKLRLSWRDRTLALLPYRKGGRDDKTHEGKPEEEESRSLFTRIQDRVFRYESDASGNGIWVDQEYTPRMQWRGVLKLVRGDAEYERVLKAEPRLKPYFEKAPILVIWRDKIYKVVVVKKE